MIIDWTKILWVELCEKFLACETRRREAINSAIDVRFDKQVGQWAKYIALDNFDNGISDI